VIPGWTESEKIQMISGFIYNFRGLWLGIRTPRLLILGLLRFLIMVILAFVFAGLVLAHHNELSGLIWRKPEGSWLVWLWHVFSWILTLGMVAASAVFSYLTGQILFGAVIMDIMSRATEKMLMGAVTAPSSMSMAKQFVHLLGQEIPGTLFPVLVSTLLMIFGWLTPLGPVIAILSSLAAAVLLAWDNTDIIPARRFIPFRNRVRFLKTSLFFHLGFGLCFLVPFANILFLSFAPVGATLHYIDESRKGNVPAADSGKAHAG
jgi:CysZ protein